MKLIEINGEWRTFSAWCNHLGISRAAVKSRLDRGFSLEDAFLSPKAPKPATEVRCLDTGKTYKSVYAAAKEEEVTYSTLYRELKNKELVKLECKSFELI